MIYIWSIAYIFLLSCNQSSLSDKKKASSVSQNLSVLKANIVADTVANFEYQTIPFELVKKYPEIQDTSIFIEELKKNCHLFSRKTKVEKINYFKKTKIYGSNKNYIIIEYDFNDGNGSMSACPWKNQIIFDKNGKLLKILDCDRIDICKIFPNNNPFLIGLSSTAKGNGGHYIYQIQYDTLATFFIGFLGNRPQTYDAHEDNTLNEPTEFPYKISDKNKDGYNDITFSGNIVMIVDMNGSGSYISKEGKEIKYSFETPYKKIPVIFNFLYNPRTKHFEEEKDYSEKFKYIFGDSK